MNKPKSVAVREGDRAPIKVYWSFTRILMDVLLIAPVLLSAVVSRFIPKKFDVGIGPEALINAPYHKAALEKLGYKVETFILNPYFITRNFDLHLESYFPFRGGNYLAHALACFLPFYRYRCLFIYFNGGPLTFAGYLLALIEPYIYRFAKIKVVVMPYGGDVQCTFLVPNLIFKQTIVSDYPHHHKKNLLILLNLDRWSKYASWVISGCDWVDYTPSWNQLMLAHFAVPRPAELVETSTPYVRNGPRPFKILHAPNHRSIKGTKQLIKAVERLRAKGENIELTIIEKRPNEEVLAAMRESDLIADQFVIGWYAMFCLEAMSMGKPVLVYLRQDLINLYDTFEICPSSVYPHINTSLYEIEEKIKWCLDHPEEMKARGRRGMDFVNLYHSPEAIGKSFAHALNQIGILPRSKYS